VALVKTAPKWAWKNPAYRFAWKRSCLQMVMSELSNWVVNVKKCILSTAVR